LDHLVLALAFGAGNLETALNNFMTLAKNDITAANTFLILGYGITGKAVGDFFVRQNIPYYFFDDGGDITAENAKCLGRVKVQEQALADFQSAAPIKNKITGIIASPGIAPTHPLLLWAQANKTPVVGELELASWFLKGHLLGVTGTNGKSTTVKLIHQLLQDAGISCALKGNIGEPLITAVHEDPKDWYVIEESSYQTEQIQDMHHAIAVCLNVTDDHFDRYAGIAEYATAKACILKNMTSSDTFIFNSDDPHCLKMSWASPAANLPFSLVNHFDQGGFEKSPSLVIKMNGHETIFPLAECSLKGLHNHENMLASLLAVLSVKSDDIAIQSYRRTLKNFKGLPHRVELVLSQNGVSYYDDSKGTNVGSVVMALAGFEGNVILIAGGKDKLGDYTPLKDMIRHKVKKLILLGEAKTRMAEAFGSIANLSLVEDMREAVTLARSVAQSGDTVLLSPACSSFDQYRNYHERGLDFQKWVKQA
jgi:UDP-N-acetylmuramoylalanine--D-glutamate ligase